MSEFTIIRTGNGTAQIVDKATGRTETVSFAQPRAAQAGKHADPAKVQVAGMPDIPSYKVWALGA
jgi:hypothetical protein